MKLARESGDPTLEATALVFMQTAYLELGEYDKSVGFGKAALPLLTGRENVYFQVYVKHLIGNALNSGGEAGEALKVLNEALDQSFGFGDDPLKVNVLVNLSYSYGNLNDSSKSSEYADQAFRTAQKIGDAQSQINALSALNYDYTRRGDALKIIETLNRISSIGNASGINVGWIYGFLGLAYSDLGQLQKSLEYHRKSVDYERQSGGDKYNEAIGLVNVSKTYARLGQVPRSVNYSQQAIEILNTLKCKSASRMALDLRAESYLNLKDYEKAKEIYLEVLKLAQDDKLADVVGTQNSYSRLGLTEKKLGRPEAALEYYLRAEEIARQLKSPIRTAIASDRTAVIYFELGRLEKAVEAARQTLESSRASGDREIESNALYTLARARRAQKNPSAALKLIEDSLKITEATRAELVSEQSRASYLSTVREKYDFYISLLIEMQNLPGNKLLGAQAFAVSERARARGLLDLLAESYTDVSAGISPELKQREQTINLKLSSLQTQLINLKSAEKIDDKRAAEMQKIIERTDGERENLDSEIRKTNPRYAALKNPATLDLKQTQSLLDDKTVLLEYQIGADVSYLFAVGRDEFQIVKLPGDKTLRRTVETLHQSISAPSHTGLANYLVTGRELYQTLIAPIEDLLRTKSKIIIAADGALNYLPFEILLKNNTDASLDKLPYLVRDFEITYTPSASVLATLKNSGNAAKPSKSFLAFAAPDYNAKTSSDTLAASNTRSVLGENRRWSLTDLQYAKSEANRIAALFPAGQSTVFTGAQATEERAKSNELLSQFRYLHFAVHGLIDEEQPQFASLILSLPKSESESAVRSPQSAIKEDGLLQTPEIFNLRLNADLVTLSACETSLGQELRGEGIVGLTRAFFYAGTPSVLVSLWNVDDASTAELMTLFYGNLQKNKGRNKAAALRETHLKLINGSRYAHPYYWASFILQGKTGSNF